MVQGGSTHMITSAGDGLIMKRYRFTSRDEHRREWTALQLLHRYAPGLAPEPVAEGLAWKEYRRR